MNKSYPIASKEEELINISLEKNIQLIYESFSELIKTSLTSDYFKIKMIKKIGLISNKVYIGFAEMSLRYPDTKDLLEICHYKLLALIKKSII